MDEDGNPITPLENEEEVKPTGEEPKVPENQLKPDDEQEEEQEIAKDPVEPKVEEEEELKPVSPRENKRVNQLLDRLAQYEQQNLSPRGSRQPQGRGQPLIPEGEYDIDQINEMAQRHGQLLYEQGLSTAQAMNIATTFATRLEIDAPKVGSKYTFLDIESDDFNPGPTDFINRMYLNTVGYDPQTRVVRNQDLRYNEFVEGFMGVVELVAGGKVAEGARSVAKQAAQTGTRPGGVAKAYQGDDPSQMTDEQLDAMIASQLGRK